VLFYTKTNCIIKQYGKIPRIYSRVHFDILKKISNNKPMINYISNSNNSVYYRTTGGLHYRVFTLFPTYSKKESKYSYSSNEFASLFFSIFASNLWNIYYYSFSNCLDVSRYELESFRFSADCITQKNRNIIFNILIKLNKNIDDNSSTEIRNYAERGEIECYTVEMRKSKSIIDEIDAILAEHYGFTAEELDFIINYDIKYRMGKELENEDEE